MKRRPTGDERALSGASVFQIDAAPNSETPACALTRASSPYHFERTADHRGGNTAPIRAAHVDVEPYFAKMPPAPHSAP